MDQDMRYKGHLKTEERAMTKTITSRKLGRKENNVKAV